MLGREGKGREEKRREEKRREGIGGEIIDTITWEIIRYLTFQYVRHFSSNRYFLKQEFT